MHRILARNGLWAALTLLLLSAPAMAAATYAALQRPTELQYWDAARAENGYTFFGVHGTTYLLDMEGRIVHTWPIGTNPHLLDNGDVLDAATDDPSGFGGFKEVSWEGATVWSYLETRSTYHPHHDFTRIFNPKLNAYTTLYIANKDLTYAQLIAAGADPARTPSTGAQMDAIVEVDASGAVVWEWCFFDHMVQDYDAAKPNYVGSGKTVANYPNRLDINLPGHNLKADWLHCNSLDYNQVLDQIVVNSVQGEFYVIDHGNTFLPGNPAGSVALAATSAGDFMYRFGDPARYDQGTKPSILEDWTQSTTGTKQLGGAHDIQWIADGLTGAGHFLVFNNAEYLSEHTAQSYVMEINPYLDASGTDTGHYVNPPDAGYTTVTPLAVTDKAPKQISKQVVWNYASKSNLTLYSQIGCSAQRLPNGNTLVCADTQGHILEVTPAGETVWEYIVPVTSSGTVLTLGDRLPMVNSIFRAYRYKANHPALAGRTLTPGATIAGRTAVANPYAGTSGYAALQRPTETQYWDAANAYNGYTFFAAQGKSYLIDMQGRVVHTWATGTDPRLLDTGHVLDWATGTSGTTGLKELDWSGATVWQYIETRSSYHPHGDFQRIYDPKLGAYATLYLANKDVTAAECLAAGCDPADAPYDGAQVDTIVEVDMSGNVVWEWSFWDHAIQDVDATKANYAGAGKTVADYPGKIDLNLPGRPLRANWLDANSLDYNQALDQIVVNSRQGELYVIDHGNAFLAGNPAGSIALAATSAGDFLYRFGDPARYGQGSPPSVGVNWETATSGTKQIGGSANAQWIPAGLPGAGHLLVFDNNQYLYQRTPQSYVFEVNPYVNASGTDTGAYVNPPDAGTTTWTFDKDTMKANQLLSRQVVWKYGSVSNLTLFSHFGCSAQRLPNGNTLICATTEGYLVEVNATGNVVWEYINPVTSAGIVTAIGDRLPMTNAVPLAMRYASSFAGFQGHTLTPGDTITGASRPYTMAALPDTGQVTRYASLYGEDADYTINPPAYSGDGTVTDKVTGLVWQKVDGGEMTWEQAAAYAGNLSLGGFTDWRLPFAKELFSLMDEGALNPAMNTAFFPASAAEYWWSSDVAVDDAAKVWVTNAGGGIGPHPKSETVSAGGTRRIHVRCVRDPSATGATHLYGSLTDNGDGTVTDNHTGLVWQQGEVTATTWEGAIAYAESLTLAGHADWRLPNIKELQSISDLDLRAPSLDRTAFPGATATRYWSSTTMVGDTTKAWYLDTDYGLASYDAKTSLWRVRCVRGGSAPNLNEPEMKAIPAGSFVMGDHFNFTDLDHPSDELPLHTVSLDAFSIGTYDITNRQYCEYLNAALAQGLIEVRDGLVYAPGGSTIYCETRTGEPALFGFAYSGIAWDGTSFSVLSGREDHPVVGVRWEGAAAYCNWLSAVQGQQPCYNLATWACSFAASGYRLPTEAEWEYAANGGHTNPYYQFPWGSNTNTDGTWANWERSGDPYETGDYPWTTPVGFYNGALHAKGDFGWPGSQATYQTSNAVNGFGLYDMGGNVWQWVNDWYGKDYYSVSPSSNPTGPTAGDPMPDGKAYHGMRGGNWYNGAQYYGMSRISNRDPGYYRGPQDPNHPYYHVGFRVALKTSAVNTAPVISNTTRTPAVPTSADAVWVTSRITDDGSIASASLVYATGSGTGTTSTVFAETMATTAAKPWTGAGAQNAWTVTGNTLEQRTGSNYGTGNPCGLEYKSGPTSNPLTGAMVATTNAIPAAGTSGSVEFWLQSLTLDGTDGWTFQLDAGSGYVTRLSELTGSSHGWQKYHYDLQSGELVSTLKMRFQFTGGGPGDDDRIDLDQITVTVTSGSLPVTVAMADDGAHGDGAAGDGVYGGQIPAMPTGTIVRYYVSATDNAGLTTVDPSTAPTERYAYTVGRATPVLKLNEFMADAATFIPTADTPAKTLGLSVNTSGAMPGYLLLDPMHNKTTYLLDNAGKVVHSWTSAYEPGRTAYLMPNGHLFRACMAPGGMSTGGGEGGRIEERDWDGNLVWFLNYAGNDYMMHHDFKVLPNGNILMIVVEKMPYADVIAAGFDPTLLDPTVSTDGYLLPDSVVEVQPTAPSGGTVVWQWHVRDHLVQDYSASRANYGVVAQHPELIDANGPGNKIPQFWNHINGIDYNAALDQVMLSARNQDEVWVIDHNTTTAEAAGHTGGAHGKGGDLLYRWGNPQMYDAGTASDVRLYQQHNTQWIPSDCPGAGNILAFNNGLGRPAGAYSSVDEFTPPVDASGGYTRTGAAYGPSSLAWTYVANPPASFYSAEISGCQRLPNGNTLVCEGLTGRIFEVTSAGETVWQYQNPVCDTGILSQGASLPADPRGGYMTAVFRALKYPLTYAAFEGRTLSPSGPVERYSDWIEVSNPGTSAVDMAGMYLTNDQSAPTKWQVPSGVSVPAGGYLLFWADGQTTAGSRHTGFTLDPTGGSLALIDSDGATVIDSLTYGTQATDISCGRYPDTTGPWGALSTPTPGAPNVAYTVAMADLLTALKCAGGLAALPSVYLARYDVVPNGQVDLADAARIARKVVGLDANP